MPHDNKPPHTDIGSLGHVDYEKTTNTKPAMNIGTIGHVDHGKTTLTAAITKIMSKTFGGKSCEFNDIDKTEEEQRRGITITQTVVSYSTDKKCYAHSDCPGHADYVKNFIVGASQMDVAILVVSAADGPQEQTREHILLAKQVGVKKIVVFLNKYDIADPELTELALEEIKALLKIHGFIRDEDGYRDKDLIIVKGSALKALAGDVDQEKVILDFIKQIDEKIETPKREINKPFLMPIDHAYSITGRGTVVTGLVDAGRLVISAKNTPTMQMMKKHGEPLKVVATSVQAFHKTLEAAEAGSSVGILLRGVDLSQVERGDVLCEPGTAKSYNKFTAKFHVVSEKDGGRHTPFFINYRPQFFFRNLDITGTIVKIHGEKDMILPGENAEVDVLLIGYTPLHKGLNFAVREGGKTIGAGVILNLLDSTESEKTIPSQKDKAVPPKTTDAKPK